MWKWTGPLDKNENSIGLKCVDMLISNYNKTCVKQTHKNRQNKSLNDKKIVSEYDQEIPQSQTADNPVALRGRAAQPSQDSRKTN